MRLVAVVKSRWVFSSTSDDFGIRYNECFRRECANKRIAYFTNMILVYIEPYSVDERVSLNDNNRSEIVPGPVYAGLRLRVGCSRDSSLRSA